MKRWFPVIDDENFLSIAEKAERNDMEAEEVLQEIEKLDENDAKMILAMVMTLLKIASNR